MTLEKCPVCRMPAEVERFPREDLYEFNCARCGKFRITQDADETLKAQPLDESKTALISAHIANHQGIHIAESDIGRILKQDKYGVPTMSAHLLVGIGKYFPNPGENFNSPEHGVRAAQLKCANVKSPVYPAGLLTDHERKSLILFGKSGSRTPYELEWVIREVLIGQGYLQNGRADGFLEIAPKGWVEIDRISSQASRSNSGFVAMSFHSDFVSLYEQGIAPAIQTTGFDPIRIDRVEHLNRIDDEILVSIKKSRFVVADFSLDRGGIYFEAGYALGLNIPVIWTVRKDKLADVHFDNRQYNFLTWEADTLEEFRRKLSFRIEATVGKPS